MVVMRKATIVMAMPSRSCSRAMSSGKRQPQHVWLPSVPEPLPSGLAFFCPPPDPAGLFSDPMLPPVFLPQAQWLILSFLYLFLPFNRFPLFVSCFSSSLLSLTGPLYCLPPPCPALLLPSLPGAPLQASPLGCSYLESKRALN